MSKSVVRATISTSSSIARRQKTNLNGCVFEEILNSIIVRQGCFLLEHESPRVAIFWLKLTLLFWYKLVSAMADVYVHFFIIILKRVNTSTYDPKFMREKFI